MPASSTPPSNLGELPPLPSTYSGWPWSPSNTTLAGCMPDGSAWPKISIVTPSYNQGQFIEETVRSVLLQGYPNLEYIIIDGGSTDHSLEIIKKYEPWLAYWVSEPDRGQSHAINKGIQKASGDILLWLNSDDLCLPDAFRQVALTFHLHPGAKLVVGQACLMDSEGQVIGELCSQFTSWDELATNPRNSIRQISTFFARELFDELGLINESLNVSMDTELLVRFTQFHTPLVLNNFFTAYRTHSATKTHHQLIKGYEESDRTRGKYLPDKEKMSIYRRRSASNWLSLSELESFTPEEKMICVLHAVQNQPSIIFSRGFWSSLKKLCVDSRQKKSKRTRR